MTVHRKTPIIDRYMSPDDQEWTAQAALNAESVKDSRKHELHPTMAPGIMRYLEGCARVASVLRPHGWTKREVRNYYWIESRTGDCHLVVASGRFTEAGPRLSRPIPSKQRREGIRRNQRQLTRMLRIPGLLPPEPPEPLTIFVVMARQHNALRVDLVLARDSLEGVLEVEESKTVVRGGKLLVGVPSAAPLPAPVRVDVVLAREPERRGNAVGDGAAEDVTDE